MPPRRFLITAGPTREPIDSVRYLGNRSSGRLGVALADAAAELGHCTTLLLGPVCTHPFDPSVSVERFERADELERLVHGRFTDHDILIMAAAVADFRPVRRHPGKIRRQGDSPTLELEPVPDILAGVAAKRQPEQVIVGFALEPRERMIESARAKLEQKRVDLIIANPLETMDAGTIEAVLVSANADPECLGTANEPLSKRDFAEALIRRCEALLAARNHQQPQRDEAP